MYKITFIIFSILLFAFNGYAADNKSKDNKESSSAAKAKAPDMSFNDFVASKNKVDAKTCLWNDFSSGINANYFS